MQPFTTNAELVERVEQYADGYRILDRTPGDALSVTAGCYDRPDTRLGPVVHGHLDGALYRQMVRFARAIRGKCDGMVANLRDGARAHAVADAVRRAIDTGDRVPVAE